jgi:hypothetical protein
MQIILFGLGIIFGALLTYLTAYAKKKGENLATREDMQDLVKQMSEVTKATKKIEAEISSGVWDKQKRWELRRDTLFEVAKRLAELEDALCKLYSVALVLATDNLTGDSGLVSGLQESWKTALQGFSKAHDEFDRAQLLAAMVSSKQVALALSEFGVLCSRVASELASKNDRSMYDSTKKERSTTMLRVMKAIRDDLGIETDFSTLQK